jgi:hypothetical protein
MLNKEQTLSRQEIRIAMIEESLRDERYHLQMIEEG